MTFDKEAAQDDVTEPDSIEVTRGGTGDVTIAVVEEERDEHKEVAPPSSPRSPRSPRDKLRSLFKTSSRNSIGKINSASDLAEAQVDGNAPKDEHITKKGIDSDQLQEQHEEERDEEGDLSKERIMTKDTRADDDDQSQKSETSLQVLFRIIANGLDFGTDYDDRRKSRNKKAEKPKDVVYVSDISATSFLTLTMGVDEDTTPADTTDTTGGCCSCATIFENYE